MKVLVTPTSFRPDRPTPALKQLEQFAGEICYNPYGRPLEEDELAELLRDCDGYIAGLDFVTQKVLEGCRQLKVISRYGAGVDRVDLEAARAKSIPVCNTPGANAQAVADLTMGLILSVARKLPMLHETMKQGQWVRSTGVELYGKTIGILGLGAIGRGVAQRAKGFSMKLLAYDPYADRRYAAEQGIELVDLEALLAQADVVTLHLPLTADTRHIIDGKAMQRMKPGAILVNTARGGLIDEAAAYEQLRCGHLGGLGLDAYEAEPPGVSPLFQLENVVLSPHTASHTREATANMANMAVQNLIDVLSGKPCPYIVNA